MLSLVPDIPTRMWHVTLSVEGEPVDETEIHDALERLSHEHPFLLAARFASERAEIRYWDEATDIDAALSLATRLWHEHRDSAGLPDWRVVGVEVIDQETFRRRARPEHGESGLVAAGLVLPF
jgi:hypothetical protein